MTGLLQTLGTGILIGLVYALMGLSIVIVFKASEAFNFAIGEFLIIGAFLFYVLHFDLKIPLLVALPLGILCSALVGVLFDWIAIKPLLGQPPISMTIVSLGMGYIMRAVIEFIWGSQSYAFALGLPDITIDAGGLFFLSDPIWAGMTSLVTFMIVIFFLFRTRWGLAIRATSENQSKSIAYGINVRFVMMIVWAVSAACIGATGIMISNFGALAASTSIVGLRAIPVILIGGMDSIGGALVGGIIVGVVEALAGAYIEPLGLIGFKDVAPYILLLLVLIIRPYGLFGTVRIERV